MFHFNPLATYCARILTTPLRSFAKICFFSAEKTHRQSLVCCTYRNNAHKLARYTAFAAVGSGYSGMFWESPGAYLGRYDTGERHTNTRTWTTPEIVTKAHCIFYFNARLHQLQKTHMLDELASSYVGFILWVLFIFTDFLLLIILIVR